MDDCSAGKRLRTSKTSALEIKMLWWNVEIYDKTRRESVTNEYISKLVGIAPIEDKLWENRLRMV